MTTLSSPIVNVIIEQPDGELVEFKVQTDNRDAVRWDLTRGRKNWPNGQDAPLLWMTFLAWHAMKRGGDTELDIEKFLEVCVEARVEPSAQVEADPTQEAAAAAS
jgi:hypothetical protein